MKYNLYSSSNKPPLSRRTRKAIANDAINNSLPEKKLSRAEAKDRAAGFVIVKGKTWFGKGSHKNPRRRSTMQLTISNYVDGGYIIYVYQLGTGKKPAVFGFAL